MGSMWALMLSKLSGGGAIVEGEIANDCECSCCSTIQEVEPCSKPQHVESDAEGEDAIAVEGEEFTNLTAVTLSPRESLKTRVPI